MLSEQSSSVVRSTLPVVSAALGDIAELFYRKLFDAHPELARDVFNRGNQANGEQRQALAGSIAAFAGMLLEHPEDRPDAMLTRIAHKHASLGITSEQYKIVHRHLFAAIAEVLGAAVTEEVATAWDEVYWLMANALVAVESRLYDEAGVPEGEVWRQMEIVERRQETPDVVSFLLRPAGGGTATAFRPGQYVSVQVELADGARQIRQYSLSSAPGEPHWRISVKRVRGTSAVEQPEGEVSSWLYAYAKPGDSLTVSAPFGDLVLLPEEDAPVLLASAGIGNTPMLAMIAQLAASHSRRPLVALHADRSPEDHAHREEQLRMVRSLPNARFCLWYDTQAELVPGAADGPIDLSEVPLPTGLTAYLCGPPPFMRAVREHLLCRGVAAERIHYEVFGPDLWLAQ